MLKYKDTWGSTQTRVNELIVTTKVKGGNVLTSSVLKEAQRLDGLVNDHVYASSGLSEDAPEGEGRQPFGRTYGRSDLCYPKASQPNCQMTNRRGVRHRRRRRRRLRLRRSSPLP